MAIVNPVRENSAAEFDCWHARNRDEALAKGRNLVAMYAGDWNHQRVVDLGCGEGALLLALQERGITDVTGVDTNAELLAMARSFGLPVQQSDLLSFLRGVDAAAAVFTYLDVIEHLPFDVNLEVFQRIPAGSRLIIQTPYTKSIKGHEFYMNVPSHVAPYSPLVIHRMLERTGYRVVREGSIEGHHPPTWTNRLRALFVRKVLGIDPELLLGGGNYFVVADRVRA